MQKIYPRNHPERIEKIRGCILFLKVKPNRTEIEWFKTNLIQLLDTAKSEKFHKILVSEFLESSYYLYINNVYQEQN
ncbi:DUF7149 domain-containing protein [Cyclobacterium xiamenense]